MPFIIIPRSPQHDQLIKSVRIDDFDEAHYYFKSLGSRSFIYEAKSTVSHTSHHFRVLEDEVHETIKGLYYLSLTTVEEYGGFTSRYRIDFDKDNDALMFKLAWI